ncbi:MoxR family ATPase [Nannocystis sp. ILAH1]|uniref:AAA family ATPase n=1 Tax=Nannocystis sp. ILAH1 TaxID=2996789 RepID=UPI00226D88F2|nr:MoxR family ATPase [Nannocystis sp. ILAH1]MCY0995424.1 MoxR family ATPase [Nannocystis sp. ILAH1]
MTQVTPPRIRLPQKGLRGRLSEYIADPRLIAAANAAIALEMPLLLTGEPGSGKSDFAWVVANFFDTARGPIQGLHECHVRSDTRARDLLYHYDALRRFGDAQHGEGAARSNAQDPRHYIALEPLGLALVAPVQQVVLIDEIDKAPRDLPNDLLRELDRGEFDIPEIPAELAGDIWTAQAAWGVAQQRLTRKMRRPPGTRAPVVIITSNVERQLPEAFLRRCVFYDIAFPDPSDLQKILRAHWPSGTLPDLAYIDDIEVVFSALRAQDLTKKPSTSELLNWAHMLEDLPQAARDLVRRYRRALDPGTAHLREMHWSDLPGLPCLLKLREDLEKVR